MSTVSINRRINRLTSLAEGLVKELDELRKALVQRRPIPGWPGYYATDEGNIIGQKGHQLATWLRDKKRGDHNHEKVNLYHNGFRVNCYVHELVALAFHGERPEGYDIHHINFDMHDNRPENLEYLPHAQHVLRHMLHRNHSWVA